MKEEVIKMRKLSLVKLKEHICDNHPTTLMEDENGLDKQEIISQQYSLDSIYPKIPMCINTGSLSKEIGTDSKIIGHM